MLAKVRRTLKPGGEFHLLDFGGSSEPSGFLAHLFHSHFRLKDNFGGHILALMAQARLRNAPEIAHRAALFGRLPTIAPPRLSSEAFDEPPR